MKEIFFALLAVLIVQSSLFAADKIRISIPSPNAQFITFPLAQKKGFLKDEGLDGEVIVMQSFPVAALVNGEIDATADIGPGVRAVLGGLPLKVVACFLPSSILGIVSRPEIKSVKELEGKTLGVSSIGGTPDVIGRMIVKHFGLEPDKDVKFVSLTGARFATLKQGLVAAVVIATPGDFLAQKMGFNMLARASELFTYPQAGLTVNVKKLKERPDEIKRMLKAGINANRYIRREREGTIQFLMDWQRTDREVATATYDAVAKAYSDDGSMPEDGLRVVIDEMKKAAKIDRQISVRDVTDLTILREAQRELGIKGR